MCLQNILFSSYSYFDLAFIAVGWGKMSDLSATDSLIKLEGRDRCTKLLNAHKTKHGSFSWKNLARWWQQFLLTELAEVCNYVTISYFNSNFTYTTVASEKIREANYLGCDNRMIYIWFIIAVISIWLIFFQYYKP